MKRIVSLLLAVIIALSVSISCFATEKCSCDIEPVVFVHGFGTHPLYLNYGEKDQRQVFPPDTKAIAESMPDILSLLFNLTVTKNYDRAAYDLNSIADKMLGYLACDENGNSKYNVGIEHHDLPTEDHHKGTDYSFTVFNGEQADKDQYLFYYDFRIDPVDAAKQLKEYVNHIKKLTGHSKVKIACHSEGNTVVSSYLYLYGCKDVSRVIFLSPAYKGLSLIGNMLIGNVTLNDKKNPLFLYFEQMLGINPRNYFEELIINSVRDYGLYPNLFNALDEFFDAEFDYVFYTKLTEIFCTMPCIWAFCPDEYYKSAKTHVFGNDSKYKTFIDKIDYYHYNVQCNLEKTLNKCLKNGMTLTICCGYNISSIPIVDGAETQSDMLIDTEYMSIGARCADIGTTLKANSKNKYLSPDLLVDASTCLYPEYTWFIKNQMHSQFTKGYEKFVTELLLCKSQPTLSKIKQYQQFMVNDKNENLIPVK